MHIHVPGWRSFFPRQVGHGATNATHSQRAKLLGIARSRARRNIFACSSFSAFLFTLQSREFAVSRVARPFSSFVRVTPPPLPLRKIPAKRNEATEGRKTGSLLSGGNERNDQRKLSVCRSGTTSRMERKRSESEACVCPPPSIKSTGRLDLHGATRKARRESERYRLIFMVGEWW